MKNGANTLGETIGRIIAEDGYTQREIALKAGITEVSLSRYIRGERKPRATVLKSLAKALHTDSDTLLGLNGDVEAEEVYSYVMRKLKDYSGEFTPDQMGTMAQFAVKELERMGSVGVDRTRDSGELQEIRQQPVTDTDPGRT